MARTLVGLFIFGVAVVVSIIFGSHFLARRWEESGFYE